MASFHLTFENDLAILKIDQAESKANIFSKTVLEELDGVLDQVAAKVNLKGLLFHSGKPGMFVAGADLKELSSGTIAGTVAIDFARMGQNVLSKIEKLNCPTVCIIEGPALGGGLELALAFDERIIVKHPKTILGLPETKLGLIPGWGGTQRLPRIIPYEKALLMMIWGDTIDAAEAVNRKLGLPAEDKEAAILWAKKFLADSWNAPTFDDRRRLKLKAMPIARESIVTACSQVEREVIAKNEPRRPAQETILKLLPVSFNQMLATGLEMEANAFGEVAGTPNSLELITSYFAGLKAKKPL